MKNLALAWQWLSLMFFLYYFAREIGARPANIDHLAHVWRLAAVLG